MLRSGVLWLLTASLSLSACGEAVESLPPVHQFLSMRPVADAGVLPGVKVLKRFQVLREQPDWPLRAASSNVAGVNHDGDVASVLWLSGPVGDPPSLEVRIPELLDPAKFNELLVRVLVPSGEYEVVCSFWRRGERVLELTPVAVEPDRAPQTLGFPVLRGPQQEPPFDALTIAFRGVGDRAGLMSAELRERPLRSFLPSPEGAPRLIRVEDEWRAAVGLSSRRPLEGRVLVPRNSEINLHFAVPPELDLLDRHDSLRLSISDDSGLETALRISLGPDPEVRIEEGPRRIPPRQARKGARRPGKGAAKRRPRQRPAAKPGNQAPPPPPGAFDEAPPSTLSQVAEPAGDQVRIESPWTEIVLPLDDFAGREVTVRLEIVDWPQVETVCAVTPPVVVRPTNRAKTVLMITADSLRADHVGISGSSVEIDTALIDQLAERGVVFTDCYAPSNDSELSLGAVMTGTWPPEQQLEDTPVTLAKRFRQAGFATWAVLGTADLNPEFSDATRGFDRVIAPTLGERNAGETIDQLLSRVNDIDGFPLFVWLHLSDPAAPYEPPASFRDEYYPAGRDPFSEELPRLPAKQRPAWAPKLRDPAWPAAQYRSEITYLDRKLRSVFENRRLRTGIIVVTANHGESMTEHDTWFTHAGLYPDTLAVPLVLSTPGTPGPVRYEHPVSIVDLGRTLLNLAGARDLPFPGEHLLVRRLLDAGAPSFAFDSAEREDAVAFQPRRDAESAHRPELRTLDARYAVSPGEGTAAVQTDTWFLRLRVGPPVVGPSAVVPPVAVQGRGAPPAGDPSEVRPGGAVEHELELFDLANDPTCAQSVESEYPAETRELRELLLEWLHQPSAASLGLPAPPDADCPCLACEKIR